MNLTRGFNRIFILLAVLWATYWLLVYPMRMRNALIKFDVQQGGACYESQDREYRKDCVEMWNDAIGRDVREQTLKSYYRSNWADILMGITIVPVLIYGVCRVVGFVFAWVYRGFKQPTRPTKV
jgi:hypothetical protein